MDKRIVIPGDFLSENTKKAGYGTYIKNDKVYSSLCGVENVKEDKVGVIPVAGPYIPSTNDVVIGVVILVTPSNWIVDIASPYDGLLHVSEYPKRLRSEEMPMHLDVGDTAILRVKDVDSSMKVELALRNSSLQKLRTGRVIEISPVKVPRVIGHGGSMISLLKKETNCSIFVGQNGRIWFEGKDEGMELLESAFELIVAEAQRSGLTERVYEFIQAKKGKKKKPLAGAFFKNGVDGEADKKEDHPEETYRKIDVLLDPGN
ncbi:MAG: exosome complex RNA-binding protein Rrp4 [Methanosarcinaceae archaeon]|nr:exosome complex RNA-binding protein Rrp4 [Methanosarcinaceae archaeon]MDD4749123.1 exosome complex RNA-binding protein Rrp4 [Methanosarcinaceae archaeon]